MDLQTFLNSFDSCLSDYRVICFTQHNESSPKSTDELYPLLFFSKLYSKIKIKADQLINVDVLNIESDSLISQLSVSFLGLTAVYWLRSFHELDAKKKQYWLSYIRSYEGPHQLIFFSDTVDTKVSPGCLIVELPTVVDAHGYQNLLNFFKPDIKTKNFSTALFTQRQVIPFDMACLMLEYHLVAGAGSDVFMNEWLNKIVASEKSLFTLSQHFFAKSTKSFFTLWASVGPEYPEMFWTTFWSEQLWRAYYFVKMCKEKDIVQAKKVSFRLPFSLIQRDWRKLTTHELRNAHQAFYDFDFNFKNGASISSLELIFHKFLLNEFKVETKTHFQ